MKIWITDGREIENYICNKLLFEVLTEQGFKREAIGTGTDRKNLELTNTQSADFSFEKFVSFDKAISACYQYENGAQLEDSSTTNIALSYANKKVPIAKSVVDKLKMSHCSIFDLEDQMKKLVEFIRK